MNETICALDIRHAGSTRYYLEHVRRSRTWVRVHGHWHKRVVTVVGATSSDCFLVFGITKRAQAGGQPAGPATQETGEAAIDSGPSGRILSSPT